MPSFSKKKPVKPARFQWTPELIHLVTDTLDLTDSNPATLRTMAAAVKSLSDTFLLGTLESVRVYGAEARLRSAYAAYYLLANLPKVVETLESAPIDWDSVTSVLDLGTGPGTALIGVMLARHRAGIKTPVSLTALDHSPDFLHIAKNLLTVFRNNLHIGGSDRFLVRDLTTESRSTRWQGHVPPDIVPASVFPFGSPTSPITTAPITTAPGAAAAEPFDLVTAANVLVELPDAALQTIPEILNERVRDDGYVLLLEPAQRDPARRLLAIRDRLCASGWKNLFPCPGNYRCPALDRKRDWCHHRLKWTPPALVEEIDRLTGMHKSLLNFTGLVFRKSIAEPEPVFIWKFSGCFRGYAAKRPL